VARRGRLMLPKLLCVAGPAHRTPLAASKRRQANPQHDERQARGSAQRRARSTGLCILVGRAGGHDAERASRAKFGRAQNDISRR
jgi:hypothetical protein